MRSGCSTGTRRWASESSPPNSQPSVPAEVDGGWRLPCHRPTPAAGAAWAPGPACPGLAAAWSASDAGIAFPDAPDLLLVGRDGIVGQQGGGERAGGPAELQALLGLPAAQDAVEHAADEAVAAADPVEHADLARLCNMERTVGEDQRAPHVSVGVDDLAQRVGEIRRVRVRLGDAADHLFEAVDPRCHRGPGGLRARDAERELEVLLVADQDVGGGRDLGKDRAKLLLAALPERRTVVQVERDPRTVPLRGPGDLKAEAARVWRQRSDHARQMQDPRPLPTEDPVEVEVVRVERAADLTGAVVVHARTAATSTAVGDVELVPITPRRPLNDLRTLIGHVPAGEIMLDQRRDRTARNKRRQHLHR